MLLSGTVVEHDGLISITRDTVEEVWLKEWQRRGSAVAAPLESTACRQTNWATELDQLAYAVEGVESSHSTRKPVAIVENPLAN